MTRIDFFLQVQDKMKHMLNLPCGIEYYDPLEKDWVPLGLGDNYTDESELSFTYSLNSFISQRISEDKFDKYYNGIGENAKKLFAPHYTSKLDVAYNEDDYARVIRKLRNIITQQIINIYFPEGLDIAE